MISNKILLWSTKSTQCNIDLLIHPHQGASNTVELVTSWKQHSWAVTVRVLELQSGSPVFNPMATAGRFVLGSPKFNSLVMPVNSQLVCLWPVGILNHDCFVYFSYLFLPFSICWVTIYNVNCWVTSNIIVLPLQSHLFSFCANLTFCICWFLAVFYCCQVLTFLDKSGGKLNYRLYGECLFDILFAGGVLGMMFLQCKLKAD